MFKVYWSSELETEIANSVSSFYKVSDALDYAINTIERLFQTHYIFTNLVGKTMYIHIVKLDINASGDIFVSEQSQLATIERWEDVDEKPRNR